MSRTMSGISTAATGDVTLAGDNVFTGTNSFNTNRPTSTLTDTAGSTDFITKQNGEALFAPVSVDGDVKLDGNPNAFTGTNTFNTNRPTSTLTDTAGSTDFITKQNGEALFAPVSVTGDVKLDGNPNTFTGTNSFNTNRPTSTLTDTAGSTDFITKQNGEALFAPVSVTGDVTKSAGTDASPQTFTGFNKFNNDVDMADNLTFSGAASGGVPNIRINGVDNFITMTGDIIQTASNSQFKTDGDLMIGGDIRIGSSTATPRCPLDVTGSGGATSNGNRSYFQGGSTGISQDTGGFGNYGIFSNSPIGCNSFFLSTNGTFSSSDIRIKKDVKTIDEAEAMEKIRTIRPVNYKYIDERTNGDTIQSGFIAQEINEVLPSSITLMEKPIPNIYECVKVSDTYTITFTKPTPLKVGDGIEFYGCYDIPRDTTITEVINDTTIKIKDDLSNEFCDMSGNKGGDCLFCYGVLIKDFQHLKHDEVFTTLLAAVKLMDKQITKLEAQIKTLL